MTRLLFAVTVAAVVLVTELVALTLFVSTPARHPASNGRRE